MASSGENEWVGGWQSNPLTLIFIFGRYETLKEHTTFPQHNLGSSAQDIINPDVHHQRPTEARQFFFSHVLPSVKYMATGRIKSKTGKGHPLSLCAQLPRAHQPSPLWFTVTICGKREGEQAWWFLLHVAQSLKPWNHSGKARKTGQGFLCFELQWGFHWLSSELQMLGRKKKSKQFLQPVLSLWCGDSQRVIPKMALLGLGKSSHA